MAGLTSKATAAAVIRLSHVFGADRLLVQAGGGNISAKTAPDRMAIKASGCLLREVDAHRGWTWVNPEEICQGLRRISSTFTSTQKEMAYAGLLGKSSENPGLRPSMEAGFHAILPDRYIAHAHSLAGILLGLLPRKRALSLLREAGPKAWNMEWISPHLPGYALSHLLLARSRSLHSRSTPTLRILQNHGIIWTGPVESGIVKASRRFEKFFRAYFSLERYPFPHSEGSRGCRSRSQRSSDLCFCAWPSFRWDLRPLFPDFVIYFDLWSGNAPDVSRTGDRTVRVLASDARNLRDKTEVFFAHAAVHTVASRFGRYPALPESMVGALKQMETERLRILQARAS